MIDLHCHYLPGIDDGARDMREAMTLARASAENGITHAVLTPHVYAGRWDNTASRIAPVFAEFVSNLERERIDLSVSLGGEVHLLPEAIDWFERGELPFLGGWRGLRVVLLEMPDGQVPVGAIRVAEYFLARGVVPMIAHPERNKEVMRDIRRIEPFLQVGCLLQLTAASVCGWFGAPAHRTAHELIGAGWAFAVSTDAHNLAHRPPVLAEARQVLDQTFGPDAAFALTERNPGAVVAERAALGLDVPRD